MCSCDQSLVTVAFLWEKLSQPQFYKDLARKNAFFEGWSWFRFNNLELALDRNLKFYTSVANGLKLKVLGANSYVYRSYRGKTGREGPFCALAPPWSEIGSVRLYKSFARPYMDYTSMEMTTLRKLQKHKLEVIQNRCLRYARRAVDSTCRTILLV